MYHHRNDWPASRGGLVAAVRGLAGRRTARFGGAWRSATLLVAACGLVGAVLPPAQAAAQGTQDFLLRTPRVSLAVRMGWNLPRAGGADGLQESLWDFTRERLTVETGDFGGLLLEADLGIRVTERFDATFMAGRSVTTAISEFRNYVGEDDLPIAQTTEFAIHPLTAGVKAFLWPRGRGVGRFAYIPRRWNAYAGVSGGVVRYRFQQYGEFVDAEDLDIFRDDFRASGTAPTVHVRAGVEVGIHRNVMLTAESRYAFASGSVEPDFTGFADLDLAGFQASAGIAVRF